MDVAVSEPLEAASFFKDTPHGILRPADRPMRLANRPGFTKESLRILPLGEARILNFPGALRAPAWIYKGFCLYGEAQVANFAGAGYRVRSLKGK